MKAWKWLLLLVGPLLVGLFIGLMVAVIYPRSMRLAGFLCPEDKPDAFVVTYSTTSGGETGSSFTLYCMSERGEVREVGTWRPMLVVCAWAVGFTYAIVLVLFLWGVVRRSRRDRTIEPFPAS